MYKNKVISKDVTNKRIGTCLIFVISISLVMIIGLFLKQAEDRSLRNIDNKTNGNYSVELNVTGDPIFPFGSQDGTIILKENNTEISCVSFQLMNDGKNMDNSNWSVEWLEDKVVVTISGEEQNDAIYYLYFNGDHLQVQ